MHGVCGAGKVNLSSVTLATFILFTGSCPLTPSKYMPTIMSTCDLHASHRNGDYGWYFPILLSSSPLFPFCYVMLVWESAKCFPGAHSLPAVRFCHGETGGLRVTPSCVRLMLTLFQQHQMSLRIEGSSPTMFPLWDSPSGLRTRHTSSPKSEHRALSTLLLLLENLALGSITFPVEW